MQNTLIHTPTHMLIHTHSHPENPFIGSVLPLKTLPVTQDSLGSNPNLSLICFVKTY